MADLEKAATLADLGKQVGGVAGRLINTLKGTSRSSGYSKESAKFHRRQHWALCDYFGLPAVFLTITPCDECTFRVRLFADAGNPQVLPKLVEDPFSIEATEICDADFKLRSKQRTMYPGACALVYESLMQIVIECLLGWNSEEQRGGQVGGEGILAPLKHGREQTKSKEEKLYMDTGSSGWLTSTKYAKRYTVKILHKERLRGNHSCSTWTKSYAPITTATLSLIMSASMG